MGEKLRWSASVPYYFAYNGDVIIEVPHEVFRKHLVAYLAQQGMAFKTWSQLDREAREAWEKQYTLETALKADLDYWMNLNGQDGVCVRQAEVECHGEWK
jgi:hypothetical protein